MNGAKLVNLTILRQIKYVIIYVLKELGDNMKLNEKLLKLRINNNLSQTDVAKVVGTTRQTISNYERGISVPDAYQIFNLAKVFNISMDELYKDIKMKNNLNI